MNITEPKTLTHPFLEGLSPEHVALVAEGSEEQTFSAGEVLIRQGEPANRMFLVQKGKVALEWHPPGQKNILLAVVGPGQVVGWSWLFPPFVSHFKAHALEPVNAIVLHGGHLLAACEDNYDFGYEWMNRLAQVVIDRLQSARKQLAGKSSGVIAEWYLGKAKRADIEARTLREVIDNHSFLHGLSKSYLGQLAGCAMEVQFEPGQFLFKVGEMANRFYLIHHGRVALECGDSGYAQTIQVLADGDVVGWSWLYEPYQWHFDARAVEPTSAVFLYGTRLRELFEKDHCFGYELLKRITRVVIQRLEIVCEASAAK